jgi:hypothetical protein
VHTILMEMSVKYTAFLPDYTNVKANFRRTPNRSPPKNTSLTSRDKVEVSL